MRRRSDSLCLFITLAALVSSSTLSALEVVSISPAAHALAVDRSAVISLTFDEAVDATTVDGNSFVVMGRFTGIVDGVLAVDGSDVTFTPSSQLAPGDWVTVRLSRDIRATGGSPLANGYTWNYWTAAAAVVPSFTEIAQLDPGDVPYGAHGGDIDHDGDLDLAIPNEGSNNMAVYLNDGSGSYAGPVHYATGSVPSPIEPADFNKDGHIDLVVANTSSADISVFLGNGDGTFADQVRYDAGVNPRGISPADLDRDGDLDLVVTNRSSSDVSVFGNLGSGQFTTEIRLDPPGFGETAVVATDLNNDGLEDLMIGYHDSDEIRTAIARPEGGYSPGSVAATGGGVWQMAVGDLNGDGLLDAVTANFDTDTAGVLLATGPGVLADAVTYDAGNFPIAIDVGDLDGDGDLDMVTSNFLGGTWSIFRNRGDGTFDPAVELDSIIAGSCAVLHDRDGDGDLDFTGIDELADRIILFENG